VSLQVFKKEDWLDRVYRKSESVRTKRSAETSLNMFEHFCKNEGLKESEIIESLQALIKEGDIRSVCLTLDKFIQFLNEDHLEIPLNPKGWIPIQTLYNELGETPEEYEINLEYFSRAKLTQTLRRLGFKFGKKAGGYSWLITRFEIDDAKEHMGLIEPKQQALTLTSEASEASEASVSRLDNTNKTEVNEVNEVNEVKVRPNQITNKTEVNEVNEVKKNNETSVSFRTSVKKD